MTNKNKQPVAVCSGITGQDGSYLAELLLEKGYKVVGIRRRTSTFNTERVEHIYKHPNFITEWGNITDAYSLYRIVNKYKPDEIYNLAAMSHVKVSFDCPEETLDTVAKGTLHFLNIIKEHSPHTRFYQASSSEMYGVAPCPPGGYTENDRMEPASPYACAKLYAHNLVKNYRASYGLHLSSGILFNHECISFNTPIIVRKNNQITVCRAVDLIPLKRKGKNTQTYPIEHVEIWDGKQWTNVKAVTATKKDSKNKDHNLRLVQSRYGVVTATNHHKMLLSDYEEIRADELKLGDKLAHGEFPTIEPWSAITKEQAELFGLLASDGYVSEDGTQIRFTNNDEGLRNRAIELWSKCFLGSGTHTTGTSGFNTSNKVMYVNLTGCYSIARWLRQELYTFDAFKKVPDVILNSSSDIQRSFLDGYYAGDGLKKGNNKAFKTNSAVLAQGLLLLYAQLNTKCSVYAQQQNGKTYYLCNLLTNSNKGKLLNKDKQEVRKLTDDIVDDEWTFDLETASGVFNAGIGTVVVHNSPRRGETFISKKITQAAARIKLGKQDKLYLGNLEAKRDWGHAKDYVEAMWLMLQQDKPDDYVIATGEARSVQEFLDITFNHAGLLTHMYVEQAERYLRPQEVPYLLGNASKAKRVLGWQPKTTLDDLIKIMFEYDLQEQSKPSI